MVDSSPERAVAAQTAVTYRRGAQLGNRPDVFAKIGDSNTSTGEFLSSLGCGRMRLAEYRGLAPTARYFAARPVQAGYQGILDAPPACTKHNSFTRVGFASHAGWGAETLLTPFKGITVTSVGGRTLLGSRPGPGAKIIREQPRGTCPAEVSAVRCELLTLKPSVALIMVGTNDVFAMAPSRYATLLRRVVRTTADAGTIPVLSTIPPRHDRFADKVVVFNRSVARVARVEHVRLWDLYSDLRRPEVLNDGLERGGVHLMSAPDGAADFTRSGLRYGMNVRNLGALKVLADIRAQVQARDD